MILTVEFPHLRNTEQESKLKWKRRLKNSPLFSESFCISYEYNKQVAVAKRIRWHRQTLYNLCIVGTAVYWGGLSGNLDKKNYCVKSFCFHGILDCIISIESAMHGPGSFLHPIVEYWNNCCLSLQVCTAAYSIVVCSSRPPKAHSNTNIVVPKTRTPTGYTCTS